MKLNVNKILIWTPQVLVAIFLIVASAMPKIFMSGDPAFLQFAAALGMTPGMILPIGLLELLIGILLLIPRTATLAYLMFVGLAGGAMATILTHTAEGAWWWFPLIMLVLASITVYFTLPELLDRVKGKSVSNTKSLGLRIFSWVLVVLLLLMHAMAIQGKIMPPAEGTEGYAMALSLGMVGLEIPLLIIELLTVILFLIPRTSALGAILMIGYMSGVLATFLTHGLGLAGSAPGFVLVAFAGIAAWIRNPELAKRLIKGKYPA